jgi:hypothetical protein
MIYEILILCRSFVIEFLRRFLVKYFLHISADLRNRPKLRIYKKDEKNVTSVSQSLIQIVLHDHLDKKKMTFHKYTNNTKVFNI